MRFLFLYLSFLFLGGCATGGGGGDGSGDFNKQDGVSTEPINAKEAEEYKKAIIRCHKTGGSRIVKIRGTLRCF